MKFERRNGVLVWLLNWSWEGSANGSTAEKYNVVDRQVKKDRQVKENGSNKEESRQ